MTGSKRNGSMRHRHTMITSSGVTPAYAGHVKLRRSDQRPPPRIDGLQVEYGGLAIIDRTGCPGCFDQ